MLLAYTSHEDNDFVLFVAAYPFLKIKLGKPYMLNKYLLNSYTGKCMNECLLIG